MHRHAGRATRPERELIGPGGASGSRSAAAVLAVVWRPGAHPNDERDVGPVWRRQTLARDAGQTEEEGCSSLLAYSVDGSVWVSNVRATDRVATFISGVVTAHGTVRRGSNWVVGRALPAARSSGAVLSV